MSWNHSLGKTPRSEIAKSKSMDVVKAFDKYWRPASEDSHSLLHLHLLRHRWLGERWQGLEPGCAMERKKGAEEGGSQATFLSSFFFSFIYLFLAALHCFCAGFLIVVSRRLLSCCGVWASHGLASLVEHRLWAHGLQLQHASSVVVAQAWLALRHVGSSQLGNPCPLHWQVDSYLLHHQGSPRLHFWQHISRPWRQMACGLLCVCVVFEVDWRYSI